jgi:hypothetical protein
MRIHFTDRQQAARFAVAVTNVTGREPLMTRTATLSWLVQTMDLNDELAGAIYSLLERGTPPHQVTLDQVAEQVESERRAQAWTAGDRDVRRPAAILPLLPAVFSAMRADGGRAAAAAR